MRPVFSKPNSNLGFTLIELMVVIAIIVLAAGLMTPTITDFFKGRQLENVRGQIGSALNTARLKAVSEGKDVSVVFFREGVRIYDDRARYFIDENFNPDTAPGADDSIWFELGFLDNKLNHELPRYRDWEKRQKGAREAAGKAGRQAVYNVRGLPKVTFQRDGSLRFDTGQDVPTASYNAVPPQTRGDIMVFQKGNTLECYVDLRPAGQFRSKVEVVEKPRPAPAAAAPPPAAEEAEENSEGDQENAEK